jgi:formylglycine-generating enzyme required for sulfatase activity
MPINLIRRAPRRIWIAVALVSGASTSAAPFDVPMCLVPGGGEPNGPAYSFWMGRYEVTIAEYFAFLNDAEANPNNERGAFMVFDPNNGDVGLPDGNWPDDIFDMSDCNTIWTYFVPHYAVDYDPNRPIGSRYACDPNIADYPIVGVSWIGAVKFCNWLTIDHGLDPNQRCYAEGNTFWDWYPVTISKADWMTRNMNDTERAAWVSNYAGYRLPMDNLGLLNGYIDGMPNPYNEWYKAAAYDSNAPATWRTGAHGEHIPPYHWMYGYGSDSLDTSRANFVVYDSNYPLGIDPNCPGYPTPVGHYASRNNNPWTIDDLCGNVYEWGTDYSWSVINPTRHATHSKSFESAEPAAALRHYRQIDNGTTFLGLRVAQCGGVTLSLDVAHANWGQILVEPDLPAYPPGALVTLTAVPNEGKRFQEWTLWDPNHPSDVNHVTRDPNTAITILMNNDMQVDAAFKCGSGMEQLLPLLVVGVGICGIAYRRISSA